MHKDDGPVAFDVSLGIVSGRHSPNSDPYVVKVNADTKVHWLFVQGAFILRSVHGRDHAQLQKDFDLYLKRPDSDGDICLNPSREIAEYGIKRNDELEFRHKALPISVEIDLYRGEKRKIEVNSGHPVMDVVPSICKQFGIQHREELSLARVQRDDNNATQYEWLNQQSSLNGQGIEDGDTLLLRKKFFILNEDVQEAVSENPTLSEMLYHQVHEMFVGDNFVGISAEEEKTLATICCLLHHIEQENKSISDEQAASRVLPKCRQHDQSLLTQIITTYFQERVSSLTRDQAKRQLLELFLQPQSILITYYPVKLLEDSGDYILVNDSRAITLCTVGDTSLKPVKEKVWRFRDIRGTDCTHKQQLVSVNALGSWQEFSTRYSAQISSHVLESLTLVRKRLFRNRIQRGSNTSPTSTKTTSPATLVPTGEVVEPGLHSSSDRTMSQESLTTHVTSEVIPSPEEAPAVIEIPPTSTMLTPQQRPPPVPEITIEEAGNVTPCPGEEEEEKKRPLTPSTDLSFSSMHIPEYFGLDYRDVLRDYRLFHLVVMNRDKRSLLLNIKKPAKEVIANTCAIFGIPNAEEHHLWLPRGKQHIIQKYGGKPKKRIGKFRRRKLTSIPTGPEPCLDPNKTLEDQYNFNIKPLVLHLHHCHPHEDETDHLNTPYDEVDMGMEWPPQENRDVRTYRQFYQSWCGAVQGAYPLVKEDAIRLAALLTHTYYGDRVLYKSWPPEDYDMKVFLPEAYCKTFGIGGDVEKAYSRLSGRTSQECIVEASEYCTKKTTHQGIFFEVSVPGESDILSVIRWKKMQPQLFGVNSHGVFSVDKDNGQILFTHRFSDIFDWKYGENTFKLNFSQWSKEYHAYTYQREEILDTLQLYIDMTRHGIISQAPSRPTSALIEMEREMQKLGLGQRASSPQFSINISVSPESSPGPDTPLAENPPQLGDLEDSVETPGTREVIVSAV